MVRGLLDGLASLDLPFRVLAYVRDPAAFPARGRVQPVALPVVVELRARRRRPAAAAARATGRRCTTATTCCRRGLPCPAVLTISDCSWARLGESMPVADRLAFRRFVPWSAKRAAHITTISEHARTDLLDLFDWLDPAPRSRCCRWRSTRGSSRCRPTPAGSGCRSPTPSASAPCSRGRTSPGCSRRGRRVQARGRRRRRRARDRRPAEAGGRRLRGSWPTGSASPTPCAGSATSPTTTCPCCWRAPAAWSSPACTRASACPSSRRWPPAARSSAPTPRRCPRRPRAPRCSSTRSRRPPSPTPSRACCRTRRSARGSASSASRAPRSCRGRASAEVLAGVYTDVMSATARR